MSKRFDKPLLIDIVEAAEDVLEWTKDMTFDQYVRNELTRDATMHKLQAIGSAASKVSDKLKLAAPNIAWSEIIETCHRSTLDLNEVSDETIFRIVHEQLLPMKDQLTTVLEAGVE